MTSKFQTTQPHIHKISQDAHSLTHREKKISESETTQTHTHIHTHIHNDKNISNI